MIKLNRIPNIALAVVVAISVVLIALLVSSISPDVKNATMGNWININLRWMYILLFLAVLLLIFFAVFQTISEFKEAKGSLAWIGAIIVIFLIAFLFSSKEYPTFFGVEKFIANGTITPNILRIIDTALFSTYFMFGLAVIALIYSSVSRYLK